MNKNARKGKRYTFRKDVEMGMLAHLRVLDRSSPRREVKINGTIRQSEAPIDVSIANLSETGFGAILDNLTLETGAHVAIGIQSLGVQRARVVWSDGARHGFEFAVPLRPEDVEQANAVNNVVTIEPSSQGSIFEPPFPDLELTKWPRRIRVLFLLGIALAGWAALIAIL